MNKLTISYQTIRPILNTLPTYYIEQGDGSYSLFVVGDEKFIISHILASDFDNKSDFESIYKSAASSTFSPDDALVAGLIANGVPFVQPRLSDGRVKIVAEKTSASTITFYSHNWTDKTTWYEKSIRITEEAINYGDNLNYQLSHQNIIDSYHGKYTNEDFILDSQGYSYRVSVSVDGYVKTEQDPHYGTGGDYLINYSDGYIIFLQEQDPDSIIYATYHYATSSIFTIKPGVGKQLKFGVVEVQFSNDVEIKDSVIFQPYGYVDVFAPQYLQSNGGPYPSGTKIPLGNPIIYKTIQDYLNDSRKSYPIYPALGGSGWRGMDTSCIIMDWDYEGDKILRSDYGMEIRVYLQHDSAFGGEWATFTCYAKSESL